MRVYSLLLGSSYTSILCWSLCFAGSVSECTLELNTRSQLPVVSNVCCLLCVLGGPGLLAAEQSIHRLNYMRRLAIHNSQSGSCGGGGLVGPG